MHHINLLELRFEMVLFKLVVRAKLVQMVFQEQTMLLVGISYWNRKPRHSHVSLWHDHTIYLVWTTSKSKNNLHKPTHIILAYFVPTHVFLKNLSRESHTIELLQASTFNFEVPMIEPPKLKLHSHLNIVLVKSYTVHLLIHYNILLTSKQNIVVVLVANIMWLIT